MPGSRRLATAPILCALAAAACGGSEGPDSTTTVTDSAGVEIVTFDPEAVRAAYALAPEPAWSVEEVTDRAGETRPLHDVRGIDRGADGRVLVVNGGTDQLLAGTPGEPGWRAYGGTGQGPGEFERLGGGALLSADSVVGWDGPRLRMVVFSGDGTVAEERELPRIGGVQYGRQWQGRGDEAYLLHLSGFGPEADGAPWRGEGPLVRVTERGFDTVAELPGSTTFRDDAAMGNVLLAPFPVVAVVQGGVWYGDTERPELHYRGDDGGPQGHRVVRWARTGSADPAPVADTVRARLLERVPDAQRAPFAQVLARFPVAETVPAFGALAPALDGGVWIAPYQAPELMGAGAPRAAGSWLVLGPDGRPRFHVAVPTGFTPHVAGVDSVFGVHVDDLGRESVRAYALLPDDSVRAP